MDTIKCMSIPNNTNNKSKIARTFQKVINLKTATKIASSNAIGICVLPPDNPTNNDDVSTTICSMKRQNNDKHTKLLKDKRKAALEALIAKIFAEATAVKAAYAELQIAQNPYKSEAIQAADQAVVDSLKQLSELKRSFLRHDTDHLSSSPQVTLMLAEIQEQQSLMKTYEITIEKLRSEAETKSALATTLKTQLHDAVSGNKSLESKLNSSGALSIFENLQVKDLKVGVFVQFLQYTVRSVRSFVKLLVHEMESANWDFDLAVKAIEPDAVLTKPSHRCFVLESFVCKKMLEGFNYPNFVLPNESPPLPSEHYFSKFKKVTKFTNLRQFLNTQNGNSSFWRFLRGKYFNLVHAKMECSLFGNLNQRKMISSCNNNSNSNNTNNGFPESCFFMGFAEMARRVWCLNLLGFSLGSEEVGVFQVRKGCRFSEVYMESVTEDYLEGGGGGGGGGGEVRVGFTVVPGFKIGRSLVQCQVYLSPPRVVASVSS